MWQSNRLAQLQQYCEGDVRGLEALVVRARVLVAARTRAPTSPLPRAWPQSPSRARYASPSQSAPLVPCGRAAAPCGGQDARKGTHSRRGRDWDGPTEVVRRELACVGRCN